MGFPKLAMWPLLVGQQMGCSCTYLQDATVQCEFKILLYREFNE